MIITIANVGTVAQTGFNVSYQVNDGDLITENVGDLTIEPGEQANYIFSQTFNSTNAQTYVIRAYVTTAMEEFVFNDTISFNFATAFALPYLADFEDGVLPLNWTTPGEVFSVLNTNNAGSFVLTDNLLSSDTSFIVNSPVIGPVTGMDSLTFDYRFVNNFGRGLIPKILAVGDSLNVYISTDCGNSYEQVLTINSTNHVPTSAFREGVIILEDYAGETIKLRFEATWGEGDYFVNIDNVRIVNCPANFDLTTSVDNETADGRSNGRATVNANGGVTPYTFQWSSGDQTKTATNLEAGLYRVTVTDAVGCSDVVEVNVGIGVATQEIELLERVNIAPNPTTGLTQLSLEFSESVDLELRVISLVGQVLYERRADKVRTANYEIDLTNHTGGIYFVQMRVGNHLRTEKIVKLR